MALYRKYRPATFGDVVGQEQVTRPLSTALDNGRIAHAYLFSGPRGCGKTSSARILARSLNCEQGPTSTPCGTCASCVALAPGGPGNLDVMELDAASHGGVDDMRELRERALFAPAESRYRVFIIDEAHMISSAGNNALLKIVEEPPEHLIFIFATTEPERILGTIRSRTHNYPFRLLAPQAMRELLESVVAEEGVSVDDNVYPLVIRAGGGSPRDTLSILDQLLAGAGDDGLTYALALPLLGVTDLSLLDAAVDALAKNDTSAMFHTIDAVMESGHEPRRFALDLLDRMRDLVIIRTVPDAFAQGLVDAPVDRAEVLRAQAELFTPARLATLATEVNDRVSDLRGATSPRLLLEVMMAHLLTAAAPSTGPAQPAAAAATATGAPATAAPAPAETRPASNSGVGRGGGAGGAAAAAAAAAAAGAAAPTPSAPPTSPAEPTERPDPVAEAAPTTSAEPEETAGNEAAEETAEQAGEVRESQTDPQTQEQPAQLSEEEVGGGVEKREADTEPRDADAGTEPDLDALYQRIERDWTTLRQSVGQRNKVAEIMLTEARPLGLDGTTLVVGHNTGALADRINAPQNNRDIVDVFSSKLDTDIAVRCVVGTDPAAANVQPAAQKPVWNPRRAPQQAHAAGAGAGGEPGAATAARQHAAAAAQAAQAARARREPEDIPPPPEPVDDEPPDEAGDERPEPPPEPTQPVAPAPYTREDEERDMATQAENEEGSVDRRDATEVAMELLAQELDAKPL